MYKIIGADEKEYGPISGEQIKQWIKDGRVNAQTRARPEGATDWQPLALLPEFAAALGLGVPAAETSAVPPLAPLPSAGDRQAALEAVRGPVIALRVTAIIGLVLVALGVVFNVLSLAGFHFNFGQQFGDPQFERIFRRLGGGLGLVQDVVGAVVGVVVLLGASKMQKLENYQFALTASILAMLPCLSPCCVLGLPFGIWALVVINKPEVKSQFT